MKPAIYALSHETSPPKSCNRNPDLYARLLTDTLHKTRSKFLDKQEDKRKKVVLMGSFLARILTTKAHSNMLAMVSF